MLDTKAIATALAPIIKEHVDAATAPLLRRIDELERREPVAGPAGKDGASVTTDDFAPMITAAVEKAVSALPAPKDGEPGRDGASIEQSDVERMVQAGIEKAVKDLPAPRDGADGRDGVNIAGALIDREGALVVTLSNGETRSLGAVVGRDGKDGADGRDGLNGERGERGFSLESFGAEMAADGRTILLKFAGNETVETHELPLPVVIYRGVFKDGQAYAEGDEVTWAGSAWHCNAATTDKPGEGSKAWTLKVKKGRDGKDGAPGERGEKGLVGPAGRDLTQVGPGGAKW